MYHEPYHVEVDRLGLPLLQVGVDGRVVTVTVAWRRSLKRFDPDLLLKGLNAFPVKTILTFLTKPYFPS